MLRMARAKSRRGSSLTLGEEMSARTLAAKILVASFAVGAGVFSSFLLEDHEFLAAAVWTLFVVAPAIALLLRIYWCRGVVTVCAILSTVSWSLLPAMQHEIDRSPGFWLMWSAGEAFLAAVVWAVFSAAMKKKPNKAPEPTP